MCNMCMDLLLYMSAGFSQFSKKYSQAFPHVHVYITVHVHVHVLAQKYDICELKKTLPQMIKLRYFVYMCTMYSATHPVLLMRPGTN